MWGIKIKAKYAWDKAVDDDGSAEPIKGDPARNDHDGRNSAIARERKTDARDETGIDSLATRDDVVETEIHQRNRTPHR
jgi:hypothetical protein